jgi:pyruvate dehydrogenase E2 component (dihydrolipoamide acetyltransferase)
MFRFKLPDIGEGVTEGEIVKWLIKEGDHIIKDQDMVEVMTDKVNINIPSPVAGKVVKLFFNEGQVVKVGDAIIEIDNGDSSDSPKTPAVDSKAEEAPKLGLTSVSGEENKESNEEPNKRVLASPTIRRIAKDRGIDLSDISPTGPNSRVTLEDLDRAEREKIQKVHDAPKVSSKPINSTQPLQSHPLSSSSAPHSAENPKEKKPEIVPSKEETVIASDEDQIIDMHGLRRIIFDKMSKSKQIMPHFTIGESVDISKLSKTITEMKDKGTKVSLTAFFVKAVSVSLTEFPKFNSHYDEVNKRYVQKKNINIGVAIDTPAGLTVAVVKKVTEKSIIQISNEISELAKNARENKLTLSDVQDSTFTISNVGSIGGLFSTPIINYPEVAIIGVHRTTKSNTNLEPGTSNTIITLSCDHRLIDGADAARFIEKVKSYLEDPISFLIW